MHRSKFILFLISLVLLTLSACAGKTQGTATPNSENLPPVKNSSGVTAEAQVVPVRNVVLSFQSPGVIGEVYFKEGDRVQKDAVIARLSGIESAKAAISQAELGLIQAQQNLNNLNENADLSRSNAELELARAKIELKDAEEDREKLGYKRASQATVDELRANFVLAQQALDDAENDYGWVQDAADDDLNRAYAQIKLSAARKARDRAVENLNYALGTPDPEDIAEADAKISVAKEQVATAEKKTKDLEKGPDPDDLELATAQVKNAEIQLGSAKKALENLDLKAPFDGSIATNNLEVGQYVTPGMTSIEIGDFSQWKVETTDLTELDVVGINPGDPVVVEFDALPDLELTGKVEKVKPRGQNTRGDITYVVVVGFDEQDDRLLWAMTAVVKFSE